MDELIVFLCGLALLACFVVMLKTPTPKRKLGFLARAMASSITLDEIKRLLEQHTKNVTAKPWPIPRRRKRG